MKHQQLYDNQAISYMRMAFDLAMCGLSSTGANPRVGCILVKQGKVVGRGWHKCDGDLHAEIMAIKDAGNKSRGSHAYVTLEPCNHQGKQPPCTLALIDAGVKSVTCASLDPNPLISGSGINDLRNAGISVEHGLLDNENHSLNVGFFHRMKTSLPWVRMKIAVSFDGKIAAKDGSSQWLTDIESRQDVMHWRSRAQAIVTGRGTVERDNPKLNVRGLDGVITQPLAVILDSKLKLPASLRVLQRQSLLVSARKANSNNYHPNLEHLVCADTKGQIDLHRLCAELGRRGVNELHLEAGSILSSAFLNQGLVDEMLVYKAPLLLGANGIDAFDLPIDSISDKLKINCIEQRSFGVDWRYRFLL